MFKNINWIAVIIAVVLLEVLGFLWYGPVLGEAWSVAYRDSIGRDPDMSNLVVTQSLGVVNTLILVFGLAWLFGRMGCASIHDHPGALSTSPLAVDWPGGSRFVKLGRVPSPLKAGQVWLVGSPHSRAARTSSGWASQTSWRPSRPLRNSDRTDWRARR